MEERGEELRQILEVDESLMAQPPELSTNIDQDFEVDMVDTLVEIPERVSEITRGKMLRSLQTDEYPSS